MGMNNKRSEADMCRVLSSCVTIMNHVFLFKRFTVYTQVSQFTYKSKCTFLGKIVSKIDKLTLVYGRITVPIVFQAMIYSFICGCINNSNYILCNSMLHL